MFRNAELEFERNRERYAFLRWGQEAFDNFKVVPPNTGIVHQVNLEFLARVIETRDGRAFPDTLVGTDSHTTMINGLGVLGWGVGGIEAEAAMLGEAVSMLDAAGRRVQAHAARCPEGATATDLVLTVTQMLRETGVVGKFVEYFGHGLVGLPLADRATIGNMSPEYGATCGFFPVDDETLKYLRLTGRDEEHVALVEAYCKENALWHDPEHAARVLAGGGARPLATSSRRSPGRAGRRTACRCARRSSRSSDALETLRRRLRQRARRGGGGVVPRQRSADDGRARARRPTARRSRSRQRGRRRRAAAARSASELDGERVRARARVGRDRGDHVLHEHVEPAGDDRRRPAGEEGGRARDAAQAVGEVVASRRARRS